MRTGMDYMAHAKGGDMGVAEEVNQKTAYENQDAVGDLTSRFDTFKSVVRNFGSIGSQCYSCHPPSCVKTSGRFD
jgi:hypothetical protein